MNKFGLKSLKKEQYILILILALSAVLNIANLGIEGYANSYYGAGVKSMTMSWNNFFFVAFDPSGFVSIDKPPLGFWIQALSARVFGFSSWSILLPQAIAGVISVWVLYRIVKRSFGTVPALTSALILSVTPVFVAVSRNNTIDNLLVMTLLFACWALSIAAENGKLKWLIVSMVLVGLGFNIKMLQAYMILPAIYVVYLLSSAAPIKRRIIHLIAGTAILMMVSFSWAVIVDLVPSGSRPYVGSSTNNSVIELIIGHNGLERLGLSSSKTGARQQRNIDSTSTRKSGDAATSAANNANTTPPNNGNGGPPPDGSGTQGEGFTRPDDGNRPNGALGTDGGRQVGGMNKNGGGAGTFGGNETSSIIRLFLNNSLSDQIIWMFPLAIIGFLAAAIKEKITLKFDTKKKQSLLLFITWLIPEFVYFSYTTGLFHPYYLTMMAAPIAALAGIGLASMWELYKEKGWKSWLLPAGLSLTAAVQLLILSYNYNTAAFVKYLMIAVAVLCFGSSLALIALKFISEKAEYENREEKFIKARKAFVSLALAALLAAPAIWSGTAIFYKSSGTFPAAGLSLLKSSGMGNMGGMNLGQSTSTAKLVEYLKANKTTEKYLVAVPSANSYATEIILNYGESVMTLGGFSGSDNILTLDEFKQKVKDGEIRYAIINGGIGGGGNNEITSWIQKNGTAVSESQWSGTTSSSTTTSNNKALGFEGRNSVQLYDLKNSIK